MAPGHFPISFECPYLTPSLKRVENLGFPDIQGDQKGSFGKNESSSY